MNIWIAGAVVLACFIIILMIRAVLCKWKGRKLAAKCTLVSEQKQEYYCERLAKMIACRISSFQSFLRREHL